MKNISFKAILPHLIAVATFLLVAVIFCKPSLESGVVMQQGDFTAADAMKHQLMEHYEKHGNVPLWTTNMFSGMPSFQIFFLGPGTAFDYIDFAFKLWLPKPLNFFFLSCICFYILCMCVKIRPYIAILASLAFAYNSNIPISVVAGHDTKVLALAYAPALLGAIILIFDKKYIAGFVLTALFATLHLRQNHQQISFYLFIIAAVVAVFYIISSIKAGDAKHLLKALPLVITGGLMGVMINAVLLFPVADMAKETKRGGQLVMPGKTGIKGSEIVNNKTVGLSKEYAFDWSYGRAETMSLLFPGVMGYGYHAAQRDGESSAFPELKDNSNVGNYFAESLNINAEQAAQLSGALYWGDQPFTMGPIYLGAAICFLFIFGMIIAGNKHRWWILTAVIIGTILALGKNFSAINYFLFDHLPLYNKLRTPSMALVILQILFPLMAALGLEQLFEGNYTNGWKKFRLSVLITGGVFVLAAMLYFTFDYSKENRERTTAVNAAFATTDGSANAKMEEINAKFKPAADNQVYENVLSFLKGDTQKAKGILSALREDRKAFFGADILRSLLFVGLTIGLIALYMNKKTNSTITLVGILLLTLIDLLPFGTHYLNEKNYANKEDHQANEFPLTNADRKILEDKDPNYRVLNLATGDPFQDAKTSYYHKSIGGYHPAKLGIYDDLITYQLSGSPNPAVINMLNAKYVIQSTKQDQNSNTDNTVALPNPAALGNAWFVKGISIVNSNVDEMMGLDNFNPADTAIVNKEYKNLLTGIVAADSTATIKQIEFDNEVIKYESNNSATNLAVFSEVFYKDWNAYIDGKQTPVIKANYVLRALAVPAGKHTIEFKFEPKVYKISYTISMITAWLLTVILAWFIYYMFKKSQHNEA